MKLRYFLFTKLVEMIFLLLAKLNMFNFIWIKNNVPHPDFRFAVGNITYEEKVFLIPTDLFHLD